MGRIVRALCLFCVVLASGVGMAMAISQATTPAVASSAPVLLGDQTVEPTADSNSPGQAQAWPFTANASGNSASASVYVDSGSTGTFNVGLYSDSNGHPNTLLGKGTLSNPTIGQWNTLTFSNVSVIQGTKYWVAILGTGGTVHFRDRGNASCNSIGSQQSTLTSLPSSWTNGPTWGSCPASVYISGNPPSTSTTSTTPTPTTTTTTTTTPTTTTSTTSTTTTTPPPNSAGLHVVGNKLQNASGANVRLLGTFETGPSYACEYGAYGFSDTPIGDSLYQPMVAWHINSNETLLNQDCWLNIHGVSQTYAGQSYIDFVKAQVASMEKYNIYPVLGPGLGSPYGQPNQYATDSGELPMPNSAWTPLLWEEIANTFKNDPKVIFRLYQEPWPNGTGDNLATWQCWSQGDVQYDTSSVRTPPTQPVPVSQNKHCNEFDSNGQSYTTVGMQSLINIIRGTGATNIIQVPGVAFADMVSCSSTQDPNQCGFLDSTDGVRVHDTLASPQLMADVDNYPDAGQYCQDMTCFNDTYAKVAQVMPIDSGEIGVEGGATSFPLVQQFINGYDSLGQSYYGSQWETWANLISDYNGTPHSGWGQWYHDHILGQ